MIYLLGAINKITKEYTYPKIANKDDQYICPECNKDLVLKQGDKRIHHFAHKNNQKCNYYDKPSESQIHKDAKMLLKKILENEQNIKFIRKCNNNCCNEKYKIIPQFSDTSKILLEYKFNFNNNNKIADVAYIDNNELVCSFEIFHTHKTKENDRPEPWFEIDATELITQINNINNNKIKINCIRKNINCKNDKISEKNFIDLSKLRKIYGTESYKIYCSWCGSNNYEPISDGNNFYSLCKKCLGDRKLKTIDIKDEIIDIKVLYKKYGEEHNWEQNLCCEICRRKKYSPHYSNNKFYAICKICLLNNSNLLKKIG